MSNEPASPAPGPRTAKTLVVDGFRTAIQGTADAADRAQAGAADAVAAYRLAVSRARAAFRLVKGELGGAARRRTRDLLRAAATDTDEQLAPVALAALAGWSLTGDTRITADAVIERVQRQAPTTEDLASSLRQAADGVTGGDPASALAGAIPDDLRRRVLIRAVTDSYRAAREAASGAHRSARRFRRWHRRCLDLALQLELLAGDNLPGEHAAALQVIANRYDGLARDVGECADLLDALALLKQPAPEGDTSDHEPLRHRLHDPLEKHMKTVREGARALFPHGGKTFAHELKDAMRLDQAVESGAEADRGDESAP